MPQIKSVRQSLDERLGTDLKFPIIGNFESISGLDLLIQDISQLLLTIPGERVGRPNFGCGLRNQIWNNLDDAVIKGASSIRSALDKFEPRIIVSVVNSTFNRNTDLITFVIRFVIKDTDTQLSLIFPFRSGTELSAA